jgi:hypothetical protein
MSRCSSLPTVRPSLASSLHAVSGWAEQIAQLKKHARHLVEVLTNHTQRDSGISTVRDTIADGSNTLERLEVIFDCGAFGGLPAHRQQYATLLVAVGTPLQPSSVPCHWSAEASRPPGWSSISQCVKQSIDFGSILTEVARTPASARIII